MALDGQGVIRPLCVPSLSVKKITVQTLAQLTITRATGNSVNQCTAKFESHHINNSYIPPWGVVVRSRHQCARPHPREKYNYVTQATSLQKRERGNILRCCHGNRLHCQLSVTTIRRVCVNQENSQSCSQASSIFMLQSMLTKYTEAGEWLVCIIVVRTINEPHLHLKNSPRCYEKSSTTQNTFRPIPDPISCAGVTA